MKSLFLLGRLVFGGFFIYSGIHHFQELRSTTDYAASKKVPAPKAAVIGTGAAMIVGGSSIALGLKPRIGTAAVMGFLAGVTPMMHDFWKKQDPQERTQELRMFSYNMALLGAATALMSLKEPWPISIPEATESKPKRLWRKATQSLAA